MGYALLMLGADGSTDDRADAILSSFASHYADRVVGVQQAFIRIEREQISQGLEQVLPKGRTILEIVDTCHVDEALTDAVRGLVRRGYSVALGDFALTREIEPLLNLAHFVKLDVPRFTNQQLVK
jgi:EAL and modified HD-GYP domain-containing signal transduction protein